MMLYAAGGLIVLSLVMVVYALWPKPTGEDDAIKRRLTGRKTGTASASSEAEKLAKESVAQRVIKTVVPMAVRPVMMSNAEQISKLRMKLATAGFRADNAPTNFLASKTVVAICAAVIGAGYAWMKGDTIPSGMGIVLLSAGAGFMAPNLWLSMATSKRKAKVRNGLPDALDMLVISVESGLGLDAAFQRVGDEMSSVHPVMAEELMIVTLESQMGIPRSEALVNLSVRTGLDEVKSLVAIINQAERFGTSIARALRNQSESLRTKRRQAAEERAQKTSVKLMAPLILFIFPAILVVLAGPAALKMIEALSETGLLK